MAGLSAGVGIGVGVTAELGSTTAGAASGASISIAKSASVTKYSATGTPITYSYLVSNTGSVALTSVGVTDALPGLSAVSCPTTSLAVGASETCTATYTTTQADLDAGKITNTGVATGTPPTGANVSASSTLSIPAVSNASISINKTANVGNFSAAGIPVQYTYSVTNSGNVDLNSVAVTDTKPGLSAISCPTTSLAPGAGETCTASYTTTQADVDNGGVTNTGVASGTPKVGPVVTSTSTLTIPSIQEPSIELNKSSTTTSFGAAGTVITYDYAVTNSGNVTLSPVGVKDPQPGLSPVTCPSSSLAPAVTETCTATYTTTQADVDAGSITNHATASGTPPVGPVATASDSHTIPSNRIPSVGITKTANVANYSAPGTVITYSYSVTNTGNVTLTSVGVTDPQPGLSAVSCPSSSLAPSVSETCTATYTTSQADVNSGKITNTGTVSATTPTASTVSATNTLTVPAVQNPSVSLAKTGSVTNYSAPGTAITYSYAVTNSGNVTLTSVGVTDPQPGLSAISCPATTLAPSASEKCTATYTTTQADVDAGAITNTGTASATAPLGSTVTGSGSLTIPAVQNPSVSLSKTANVANYSAPGTAITYTYAVTNAGNVTLTSVGVSDPHPGLSPVSCPVTTLAPAASEKCTASYTTTQADVDAGAVKNTGTASAVPPTGSAVTGSGTLTIPAVQNPSISLTKTANAQQFAQAGTPIQYSYQATDTGNVTLTSVTVTDPMPGLSAISCPTTTLAPSASENCTATYTTTQANVDAGGITNTGTVVGTPPSGPQVTSSSTVTVPALNGAAIGMTKTANVPNYSAAGTLITYSYQVTNTGNKTLSSVHVTDTKSGVSAVTCPSSTLAPSASETCTATYTTTQGDVDAGSVTNLATAFGNPPTGAQVSQTVPLTVSAVQNPSIGITKSANVNSFSAAGTPITYSYAVTNTGNVTLSSVHVTDPQPGLSAVSCPHSSLAPAVSETCTATYTTTQGDVDSGVLNNTGTASGNDPNSHPVTGQGSLRIPAVQNPSIGVTKTADVGSYSSSGATIGYQYAVTNTGNVTLTSVGVTDPQPGLSAVSCPDSTLSPSESETCTATYTTTQSDVDAGKITNTGTAVGDPPEGVAVTASSTLTVPASQNPGIGLAKSASVTGFSGAGTPITYSYVVANSGNVTLTSVGVTDPQPGLSAVSCPASSLAPGSAETCTATYTTTQADVNAGAITNTGIASGTAPSGTVFTAQDSLTVPSTRSPSISVSKSASISSFSAAGTPITYQYAVTDTGNVTLTSVGVTDPQPGLSAVSCPNSTLAPTQSETCSASYTTIQADVDAGKITNTGTVTGTPPSGPAVTASKSLTVPATQNPSVTVVKSASISSFSAPGTPVTYHYAVTNNGNVTLTSVHVIDPQPGLSAVSCPGSTLAPTQSETCSATYTTTQADVDAGGITNTGTAIGNPPSGSAVRASNSLTIKSVQSPAIGVVKSADVASYTGPGQPITYSYAVTNKGNVTLTSVHVSDPMPGLSGVNCPGSPLAPANSETCTATYTTTVSDVSAGKISNTGTAFGSPPSGPPVSNSSSLVIPFVAPACYVGPWPSVADGYFVPTFHQPPPGFFIGVVGNTWRLYTHNLVYHQHESGKITTTGTFTNVQRLSFGPQDIVTLVNPHTVKFSFRTGPFLDGLTFTTQCGNTLNFSNLTLNGAPIKASEIFLGNPSTKSTSASPTFTRPY
jgi:uncharacterized repeat protein (TIGR01451 family)